MKNKIPIGLIRACAPIGADYVKIWKEHLGIKKEKKVKRVPMKKTMEAIRELARSDIFRPEEE